jgi:hypothetical protein
MARHKIDEALTLMQGKTAAEAQWFAKDALNTLADGAQVALLYGLAEAGGEHGGRYAQLSSLYATRFLACQPYPAWALDEKQLWFPLELA